MLEVYRVDLTITNSAITCSVSAISMFGHVVKSWHSIEFNFSTGDAFVIHIMVNQLLLMHVH